MGRPRSLRAAAVAALVALALVGPLAVVLGVRLPAGAGTTATVGLAGARAAPSSSGDAHDKRRAPLWVGAVVGLGGVIGFALAFLGDRRE
jgi:hypothetical protein